MLQDGRAVGTTVAVPQSKTVDGNFKRFSITYEVGMILAVVILAVVCWTLDVISEWL